MNGLYDYLSSLPPDTKLSELPARMLLEDGGSSLEATLPVAQAQDRRKMWGVASEQESNHAS